MKISGIIRQHWAALRALLVLTVVVGLGYPLFIWLVAQVPGLKHHADGSLIDVNGKAVGSSLIGQSFTDEKGNGLPQYFQSRPSAAGNGYDPMSSGASNLGPESVVDAPGKPSLLTQICTRSVSVGAFEAVDGSRPYCTAGGVGAVLSVIGPRDPRGMVVHPTEVVSVNESCGTGKRPFLDRYEGVAVRCAAAGQDYSAGQIVPVRGTAPDVSAVPADAVTASASGLDPDISVRYADIQIARVARARGVDAELIGKAVNDATEGPALGVLGEPTVNVVELNLALDRDYPAKS